VPEFIMQYHRRFAPLMLLSASLGAAESRLICQDLDYKDVWGKKG
jgi:hypothetical protein